MIFIYGDPDDDSQFHIMERHILNVLCILLLGPAISRCLIREADNKDFPLIFISEDCFASECCWGILCGLWERFSSVMFTVPLERIDLVRSFLNHRGLTPFIWISQKPALSSIAVVGKPFPRQGPPNFVCWAADHHLRKEPPLLEVKYTLTA